MPDAHPEDVRLKAVNDYLATKATAEGTTLEAVCLKHGISISSLSRYLREYREAHGVPVHERRGPLKYARLTKDQRAVVVEHALAHPASTLVELAQWATTRFERKVGVATVRYALHASGISKRRLVAQAKSDRPPDVADTSRYAARHRRNPESRAHRRSYPSDFTDAEWEMLEPLWRSEAAEFPRDHDLRDVLDAIRYVGATGCPWRFLPHDYPPHQTVYGWFSRWAQDGVQERVNAHLRRRLRRVEGREDSPSLLIVDSQTVRSREGGEQIGYDGAKKLKGRKRHIAIDTTGFPAFAVVTAASVQDRDGLDVLIPDTLTDAHPRMVKILADSGYAGRAQRRTKDRTGVDVEIARRGDDNSAGAWARTDGQPPEKKGTFVVIPKRWIVERSFAWFNRRRRLSVDYERTAVHSTVFFHTAIGFTLAARLAG
ncbi:MAG: IS5 family transposase [Myxococcales bacterium]|nr:IS5 family transposase [Myxococcales bacterium]MCB9670693.1 IS5 family transposase [Alphaproteobacteria bacterium]